jgi:hypothetical protein
MFAAMANRDLQALELGVLLPSAAKLYLAQLIGPKAATDSINSPLDKIDAVLTRTPDADLPLRGLHTRADILARYKKYLSDNSPSGTDALNRIADDLQIALDKVKNDVVTAGTEVLGTTDGVIISDPNAPGLPHTPIPGHLPNLPGGQPPADNANAGGILGKLISSGEGGYGSFNRGRAGDSARQRINFAQMTMAELKVFQSLPPGNPRRLFAVGKYQVIPETMAMARRALAIADAEKYGPPLQERIFRHFLIAIKKPKIKAFVTAASNDIRGAQHQLAEEFASVANPVTGVSNYGGVGGNRASISAAQAATALQQERQRFQQLTAQGQSAASAWAALSPGAV